MTYLMFFPRVPMELVPEAEARLRQTHIPAGPEAGELSHGKILWCPFRGVIFGEHGTPAFIAMPFSYDSGLESATRVSREKKDFRLHQAPSLSRVLPDSSRQRIL